MYSVAKPEEVLDPAETMENAADSKLRAILEVIDQIEEEINLSSQTLNMVSSQLALVRTIAITSYQGCDEQIDNYKAFVEEEIVPALFAIFKRLDEWAPLPKEG